MELSNPGGSRMVGASRPHIGQAVSAAAVKELERAIAGFQAILTDEERRKLQQLKTTSHDSQSIIVFTADLDRLDKNRRGKSVASRLASFLQTIEQFTPVIDTYIQSNPDIAALIWGSVRLTFMFLANFASYFESFVELLQGFGSLCTRFAEYQFVFSESTRLKNSICQFHTAVVTCCQQIILAVRRPLKVQILKAIMQSFQAEIRSYVENIRSKAEEVRGDIELAKAQSDREEHQLQKLERQEATHHRKRLLAWTSKSTAEMDALQAQRRRHALEQKRRRLLEDLSTFNFILTFNSTRNKRHLGTAEWVFETREFQEWIKVDTPPILHVTGKIGSGKTVLASSIVERLSQIRPPQQFVSFFFIRFDDPRSHQSEVIIRSCVQQLLSSIPMDSLSQELASEIDERLSEAESAFFSRELLLRLYLSAAKTIKQWFIVLDGLDECRTDQQSILMKFFQGLLSGLDESRHINILLSSRETCTELIGRVFPGSTRLVTGLKHTSEDIGAYVDDIVMDRLSTGELVVNNPGLVGEILKTIAVKEEGMFLWAFLTIEDLCSRKSDREIRQALQGIPTDLPATFDRALARIAQKHNQHIAKKAFSWTKAVSQPLTLAQIREALSIEIGQHTLRQEDLVSGIERLPSWCENLLYVEETDNTVRFSHHSIQEFLLVPDSSEYKDLHINPEQCDLLAGEICVTYVNLDNFQTALADRKEETQYPSHLKFSPSIIAEQTMQTALQEGVGIRIGRLARQFVKPPVTKRNSTRSEVALMPPMPDFSTTQGNSDYHFLEYASKNWFKHTKNLQWKDKKDIWNLVGRMIRKPPGHSQGEPWHSSKWEHEAMNKFPNHEDLRSKYFSDVIRIDARSYRAEFPTFYHLCLVFVYGELNGYWGLACRAFQLLVELFGRSQSGGIRHSICILTAYKNHDACRNGCASVISPRMQHRYLVTSLRKAIAGGISRFPAIDGYNTIASCECGNQSGYELMLDICQVLKTGYQQKAEPHLQAFAIVIERLQDGGDVPSIMELSHTCGVDIYELANARNVRGMLLFDILVQGLMRSPNIHDINLSDLTANFMEHLAPRNFSQGSTEYFNSKQPLITNTLRFLVLLNLGLHGTPLADEADFEICKPGKLMKLHGDTVASLFLKVVIPTPWPRHVAYYIVVAMFGKSLGSDTKRMLNAREQFLSQAITHNNWDVAAALIQVEPVPLGTCLGLVDSSSFRYIRQALLCENCWLCTRYLEGQPTSRDMLRRYSFRLCELHNKIFKEVGETFAGMYVFDRGYLLHPERRTRA